MNKKSHKFSKKSLLIKKSLNKTQADKKGTKNPTEKPSSKPRFINPPKKDQKKPKNPKPKQNQKPNLSELSVPIIMVL